MPTIKVDFGKLSQLESQLSRVPGVISSAASAVSSVRSGLDWDVACEASIDRKLRDIVNALNDSKSRMQKTAQFVGEAVQQYQKAENEESSQITKSIISKASMIAPLLNIVVPGSAIVYLTSGISSGENPFSSKSNRSSSSFANADWLGYEFSDGHPGVTAYVGKAEAGVSGEVGYANVNAQLGKVEATAKADGGFMKTKKKNEYQNGEWGESESLEFLYAEVEAGTSIELASVDGKAGLGNDMLGAEVSAEGSAGNASLKGSGNFSVGEDGINANLQGEAMISAVEGEASATFNILGLEIEAGVGGYAGALGVEGKIGIEDNKFVMRGGAAALLGVSGSVEIGLNDEGWYNVVDNWNGFVDWVTFWD